MDEYFQVFKIVKLPLSAGRKKSHSTEIFLLNVGGEIECGGDQTKYRESRQLWSRNSSQPGASGASGVFGNKVLQLIAGNTVPLCLYSYPRFAFALLGIFERVVIKIPFQNCVRRKDLPVTEAEKRKSWTHLSSEYILRSKMTTAARRRLMRDFKRLQVLIRNHEQRSITHCLEHLSPLFTRSPCGL